MIKKIASYLALLMTVFCCFSTNNTAHASNRLSSDWDSYHGDFQFTNKYGRPQWMYGVSDAYLKDLKIDNQIAFCVEPDIFSYVGTHYTEKALTAGMTINKNGDVITQSQINQIQNAVFWGWDMNPNKNNQQYTYVKCMVNDILGYTTTGFQGSLNWSEYKKMKNYVNERMDTRTPSWHGENHVVKVGESITLTDSNGVMQYLTTPSSAKGWNIERVDSNTVKLTPTASAENTRFVFRNKILPSSYEKAQALYVHHTSQHVLRIADPDYLQGFVNLEVQKDATLKLVKKDIEGNYVPNVTFEVSYNEDFSGTKWTYETGEDGTTIIPNWAGKKVYVREVKVPDI